MKIMMRMPTRRRAPMSNRERNIQRILHPPGPSLSERLARPLWAAEEWWCRHVTQRELYRRLDAIGRAFRASLPTEWDEPGFAERGLREIRSAVAAKREQGG
jgi:hypothetical protein